jgi:hypothetical protein
MSPYAAAIMPLANAAILVVEAIPDRWLRSANVTRLLCIIGRNIILRSLLSGSPAMQIARYNFVARPLENAAMDKSNRASQHALRAHGLLHHPRSTRPRCAGLRCNAINVREVVTPTGRITAPDKWHFTVISLRL